MSYLRTRLVACAFALLLCASTVLSLATVTRAEPAELRSDLPPLAVAVSWPSVANVGENVYVIGGCQASSVGLGITFDTVQIYNIKTGVTTFGQDMPKGVGAAASGTGPDGKIYVAGGWNYSDSSYYQRVQIYDPVLDSWTEAAGDIPEPIGRSASTMASDGTLYVFGGGWSSNVTMMYNIRTDVWRYGTDQPVLGYDGDAVAYSSTAVYLMGGVYGGATSNVRVYNPIADTWGTAASLLSAEAYGCAVLAKNGFIYLFGGATTSSTSDPSPMSSVMRYSVADDEWVYADATLSAGRDHMSVVLDTYGRAVVAGGYTGSAAVPNVEAFLTLDIVGENMIQISSPREGSIVSGIVEVQVEMVNGWGSGFLSLELFVDGTLHESRTYAVVTTFLWDTTALADGSSHTLMARGYNWDGSVSEASVTVTVSSMSVEERIAAIEQELADVQSQLLSLEDQLEVQDANLTALKAQSTALQAQLTALATALSAMDSSQTDAIADLNATLADLQTQLDSLSDRLDSVGTTADSSNTWGMVNMVLVIIVIVLLALMFAMSRKGKAPSPPAP